MHSPVSVTLPPPDWQCVINALRTAANHHHSYSCNPTLTPATSSSQSSYAKGLETLADDLSHILAQCTERAVDTFLSTPEPESP